jgi:hypothetical protein
MHLSRRDTLHQRRSALLYRHGCASADLPVGLQRPVQHVPHALLRRRRRHLFHGENKGQGARSNGYLRPADVSRFE